MISQTVSIWDEVKKHRVSRSPFVSKQSTLTESHVRFVNKLLERSEHIILAQKKSKQLLERARIP